jgi:hypothetical protein
LFCFFYFSYLSSLLLSLPLWFNCFPNFMHF